MVPSGSQAAPASWSQKPSGRSQMATGVPPGLGSYAHWDRRLDGRIAQAVLSIPAQKAVEIGDGFAGGVLPGSRVHDAIVPGEGGRLTRATNRAGGPIFSPSGSRRPIK